MVRKSVTFFERGKAVRNSTYKLDFFLLLLSAQALRFAYRRPSFNMPALDEELRTYAQQEEELKRTASGKFVVIKGTEIVGTFDSAEAALTEGTRRFGLEPYLVRRVGEPIEQLNIPALTLGLIGAHH
jgi:hypothetical protein